MTDLAILLSALLAGADEAGRQRTLRLPEEIAAKTKCLNPEFLAYVPEGHEESRPTPLLIFLHGRGERGTDIARVKRHGPPKRIEQGADFPFIVVSPQCLTLDSGRGWWDTSDLDLLLAHVKSRYSIDEQRIYLTGLSMGGFGTWAWAMKRPDTFAAIAPICGGGDAAGVKAIADLPIWVFHGARDRVVPLARSEELVAALKEHGSQVKFTVYPEADHDSWTETYANDDFYAWLQRQARAAPAEKAP